MFAWMTLVFGVGFSMLALLTRRWVFAWIALAGSAWDARGHAGEVVAADRARAVAGPGVGLVVGWLAVIVLTFHWARVVWTRTAVQLAAEEQRREVDAEAAGEGPARQVPRDKGGR